MTISTLELAVSVSPRKPNPGHVALAAYNRKRSRRAARRRLLAMVPAMTFGAFALAAAATFGGLLAALPAAAESAAPADMATLVLIVAESRDGYEEFDVSTMPAERCQTIAETIWHAPQSTLGVDPDGNRIPVIDAWCKVD